MDISLYYQEQGEGEPLFLLHGNGEDGTYFSNQLSFFSDAEPYGNHCQEHTECKAFCDFGRSFYCQ